MPRRGALGDWATAYKVLTESEVIGLIEAVGSHVAERPQRPVRGGRRLRDQIHLSSQPPPRPNLARVCCAARWDAQCGSS